MRILFLCHRLPYPPDHGAKIRPYQFIRYLSRKHAVTLVSLAHTDDEMTKGAVALAELCDEVIVEVLPASARWIKVGLSVLKTTPASVAYFWSDRLYKRVTKALAGRNFDVIYVFCSAMAPYVMGLAATGYRVMDFTDIDSAKWFEYAQWKRYPLSWGYALEGAKLRRFEKRIAVNFDHCAVITPGELDDYRRFNVNTPCSILPNGVDSEFFKKSTRVPLQEESPVITFVGRMDYFPNIDGVLFFVREVFPLVQSSRPDAKLIIVGSDPVRSIRDLARRPNIFVTGHVPDVRPYLEDSMLSIAPLRIARGTQNKILEAMAMGVPVVATSRAARGVFSELSQHLLVADEPEAFADQVLALLNDNARRADLGRAGERALASLQGWAMSEKVLDEITRGAASHSDPAANVLERRIRKDVASGTSAGETNKG